MADFVIIGCGYVGARLAGRLPGKVTAVTRTQSGAASILGSGAAIEVFDIDALAAGGQLPVDVTGAVLIYLVPPPGDGPADPRIRFLLQGLRGLPARFVYMSTTGVYGDAAGESVDEERPPRPTTDRGRARLDAEEALRDWCEAQGVDWTILRVPGIYGPGRLPLGRIGRGDPVIIESEAGPGNRIHVDDLVATCVAAATSPASRNRVYNVGDGNHASSTEYFNIVARLAGLPAPPTVTRAEARQSLSPAAWSYLAESRRVDTRRMRDELGVQIRYTNLEEGIRASL